MNTGDSTRVDNLVSKEQIVLNELYAKIDKEKDNVRKDADKKIELQNNRLKQAQERKDADIKAAADRFKNSLGGGTKYDEAGKKASEMVIEMCDKVELKHYVVTIPPDLGDAGALSETAVLKLKENLYG